MAHYPNRNIRTLTDLSEMAQLVDEHTGAAGPVEQSGFRQQRNEIQILIDQAMLSACSQLEQTLGWS